MRRLGTIAALMCAVVGCAPTVSGSAVGPGGKPSTSTPAGLASLLLSLDEMKQLLKFDNFAQDTWTRPDARGSFEPASCVGAVFSSMAGSYDDSGYRAFLMLKQSDTTGGDSPHWVDQGAAAFDNDSAAKDFVDKQIAQWRQCVGRQFKYAYPHPGWNGSYRIGEVIESGCVTLISSVLVSDEPYTDIRALAAKSNIVVDLQFTGFDLTDQPAIAMNRILDRITSHGHECAFWS